MDIEYIKRRVEGSTSEGDEIMLLGGEREGYTDGRYTIMLIDDTKQPGVYAVTLVGHSKTRTAGMICVIYLGAYDD